MLHTASSSSSVSQERFYIVNLLLLFLRPLVKVDRNVSHPYSSSHALPPPPPPINVTLLFIYHIVFESLVTIIIIILLIYYKIIRINIGLKALISLKIVVVHGHEFLIKRSREPFATTTTTTVQQQRW